MASGTENLAKAKYLYERMEKNIYRGPIDGAAQQTTAACASHQARGETLSPQCRTILMNDNSMAPTPATPTTPQNKKKNTRTELELRVI